MNLLIDAHVFDDKFQGTRTYLKGLYSQLFLVSRKIHFFMAARDINNLKNEFGEHENVTYIPLKSQNKFYRLLIELPQIIKKNKIDYAHYQYICPPFKNCKVIITTHDILFEQKEYKLFFPLKYRIINGILFKWSAKRADVLLTVSNYSKKKISEIYKIPEEKIKITPNAVNLIYEEESSKDLLVKNRLGKYLLYVSRVEPRKNHLNLLKAFVELKLASKGYKIIFIGKKDISFSKLEEYVDKIHPKEKESILWLENVSNDMLKMYYRNCELFVFPSFAEGFGIPPLEAMTYNKKILCSKNTAMEDFKLPNTITFDPEDVNEIKQKIKIQLKTPFSLKEDYKKILSRYNWEIISKEYYHLLIEHSKNIKN
jgi:glycosyltransferase involved in cell wall biosynthesis